VAAHRDAGLTPFDTGNDYFISVLDARAHASELALRAAQSSAAAQPARAATCCRQRRAAPRARIALRGHRLARHQAPAQGDRAAVAPELPA
jgi:hypothetical protein